MFIKRPQVHSDEGKGRYITVDELNRYFSERVEALEAAIKMPHDSGYRALLRDEIIVFNDLIDTINIGNEVDV